MTKETDKSIDLMEDSEEAAIRSCHKEGHRVTVKKHTRIYPCCRKLADRHKAQDMSKS